LGRDFPPVETGSGAHPASCTMGTASFPGVNCGRGVLLTPHPLLVPRSWKSRAIPLPTLWATTRGVTGTLYLTISMHGLNMKFGILKLFKKIKRKYKRTMSLGRAVPRQQDKMKPSLKKQDAREGIGFIWLRIETNARLLIKM